MSTFLEPDDPRDDPHPWKNIPEPTKEADIIKHVRAVLGTDAGIEVFKYIRDMCGVDQSVVDINAHGEPVMALVMKNAGLQQLWLDLRAIALEASREALIRIEIPIPKEHNNV